MPPRVSNAGVVESVGDTVSRIFSMTLLQACHSERGIDGKVEHRTLHSQLQKLCSIVVAEPGISSDRAQSFSRRYSRLLHRGLRVRVGMHSGVHDTCEVAFNSTTGRWQYSGVVMEVTKAVSSCAEGGMVLMTAHTFKQLPLSQLHPAADIIQMGQHTLVHSSGPATEEDEPQWLYQALPKGLTFRCVMRHTPRSLRQFQPGFFDAPYGRAAICYLNAVGVSLLMAWNTPVTQSALALLHQSASHQLAQVPGGCLLDTSDVLGCLAAFRAPGEAMRWALDTIEGLLDVDWWVGHQAMHSCTHAYGTLICLMQLCRTICMSCSRYKLQPYCCPLTYGTAKGPIKHPLCPRNIKQLPCS